MRTKILKLYTKQENGLEINSIITYAKFERLMDYDLIQQKHICVEWDNYLRINLWFIILDFNWVSKLKGYNLTV